MLQAIRSRVGSWVVKILFALLILSFAVWGIGDYLSDRGSDRTVIEVGDREVSLREFDNRFRDELNRLRQMFGPELETQTAIQLGLLDQTVEDLVAEAALAQAVADLGLRPPTDLIGEEIRRQPVFQDGTGRFSRTRFLQVLQANFLTEEGYVALVGRQLAQERMLAAVTAGAAAPTTLVAPLYGFQSETRRAETIALSETLLGDLPAPEEADLVAFHAAHPERFSAPEYRALTVLGLDARDIAADIAIDEAVLRDEYEARLDEFSAPERRSFAQAVVQDEAVARQIAEAARADGQSLRAAAEAIGDVSIAVIDLDDVTRDELFGTLVDAAFALAEGEVSDPLESPFGWHVMEVTAIAEPTSQSFEEVRDEIAFDFQFDRALDVIFEMANLLEDGLAAGLSLEQVAEDAGIALRQTPPLAADGRVQDNRPTPDIAGLSEMVETAFTLARGQESRLIDTPDGIYYVVRVDEIVAPEVLPLDQVRARVAEGWRADRRAAALEELAATVVARLEAGEPARAVAADVGGSVGETPDLARDGANRGALPRALVDRLFAAGAEGDVVQASAGPGQRIVARLTAIAGTDPADAGEALAPLADRVRSAIAGDLVAQFTQSLSQSQRVTVDRAAIEQFYR